MDIHQPWILGCVYDTSQKFFPMGQDLSPTRKLICIIEICVFTLPLGISCHTSPCSSHPSHLGSAPSNTAEASSQGGASGPIHPSPVSKVVVVSATGAYLQILRGNQR